MTVELRSDPISHVAEMVVSDHGVGIAPDEMPRSSIASTEEIARGGEIPRRGGLVWD